MSAGPISSSAKRIIALFPGVLTHGGVQQAGRLTAAALWEISRESGWDLEVLSLNDPRGEMFLRTHAGPIPMRGFGRAKTRFTIEATRLAKRNAGVVVAGHPNLAVPALLAHGTAAANVKTLLISHGIEVWNPLSAHKRYAMQRADVVVAPSRYTAQKLAEVQRIPAEKIRTVPWPLNPEFLEMAASGGGALPADFPTGTVILTVGRWSSKERYKGCDQLIQALPELLTYFPDLSLVVVGSGDDVPRLQRHAGDLGVSECVRFLGSIAEKQLGSCYAHADLLALPSTGEGFGIVFLEAMAFGKAVLGTAVGGPLDLITEGWNGTLVQPHESLVEPLQRLLGDRALREEMGRRGAALVRTKYAFATFQETMRELLAECGMRAETSEPMKRYA